MILHYYHSWPACINWSRFTVSLRSMSEYVIRLGEIGSLLTAAGILTTFHPLLTGSLEDAAAAFPDAFPSFYRLHYWSTLFGLILAFLLSLVYVWLGCASLFTVSLALLSLGGFLIFLLFIILAISSFTDTLRGKTFERPFLRYYEDDMS
jgi:hypothetical protein